MLSHAHTHRHTYIHTLHYITLHYNTLQYNTIHTYLSIYLSIYLCVCVRLLVFVCASHAFPCYPHAQDLPLTSGHHFEAPASKRGFAPAAAVARTPARPPHQTRANSPSAAMAFTAACSKTIYSTVVMHDIKANLCKNNQKSMLNLNQGPRSVPLYTRAISCLLLGNLQVLFPDSVPAQPGPSSFCF